MERKWYEKDEGRTILSGYEDDVKVHHPSAIEIEPPPAPHYIRRSGEWIEPEGYYKEQRIKEYPPIGDQLDAILKQFVYWRMQGNTLVQNLDDIIGQWLQVKENYPK